MNKNLATAVGESIEYLQKLVNGTIPTSDQDRLNAASMILQYAKFIENQ